MNKQLLRKWAKNKRKELDMDVISNILVNKLIQMDEYKKSEDIMIFYPLASEVNLLSLLNDDTKTFYLPRINGQYLECCRYSNGDELCESCFHTKEPVCEACDIAQIDLVIVPALACDKKNYRLGYGGGFYDRFLKHFEGLKIACIPSKLLVDNISPDKHDIKMDIVITELF